MDGAEKFLHAGGGVRRFADLIDSRLKPICLPSFRNIADDSQNSLLTAIPHDPRADLCREGGCILAFIHGLEDQPPFIANKRNSLPPNVAIGDVTRNVKNIFFV